jgi:hypothetical protein
VEESLGLSSLRTSAHFDPVLRRVFERALVGLSPQLPKRLCGEMLVLSSGILGARQQYLKGSAFFRYARQIDCPAEAANNPLDDGKPEAVARRFSCKEWVENRFVLWVSCRARNRIPPIAPGQAFHSRSR